MDPINVDLFIKIFLHSTWPPTEVCVQFPINIINVFYCVHHGIISDMTLFHGVDVQDLMPIVSTLVSSFMDAMAEGEELVLYTCCNDGSSTISELC